MYMDLCSLNLVFARSVEKVAKVALSTCQVIYPCVLCKQSTNESSGSSKVLYTYSMRSLHFFMGFDNMLSVIRLFSGYLPLTIGISNSVLFTAGAVLVCLAKSKQLQIAPYSMHSYAYKCT